MKAIIETGGKQYYVEKGTVIYVEKLNAEKDSKVNFNALMVNGIAGHPYVNGAKVTGTIASKTAQAYTPGTSVQTIAAGQYLAGAQTIAAVPTEEKTVTPSSEIQEVFPSIGKFLSKVTVNAAQTGITPDETIPSGEYGLENANSGEGSNDVGYNFFGAVNTNSKFYEVGSIVEMNITNELLAQVIGLTPDKIKAGEVICGIEGTYTGSAAE